MTPDRLDLSAYLARIGYDGPQRATFDTLAALQSCHLHAIPFETLAMSGADYAIHRVGGQNERRRLESPEALATLLSTVFEIRLPADPALRHALARVVSAPIG